MTKSLRKQQCLNPGSKMISTRKCLMKTGIIIGSKEIFMLKLKKTDQKKYFRQINVKKYFWQQKVLVNHKTIFSNKDLNTSNIMLVENNEIVREEQIIANFMNNYFTNITTHLKLKLTKIDPKANLECIINIFQNHNSV